MLPRCRAARDGGRDHPSGPGTRPAVSNGESPHLVTSVTMRGMGKTQLGARVDAEIAELARKRAADRGLTVGDYLAQLVLDDASGLRERAMGAAERFLAEHQD